MSYTDEMADFLGDKEGLSFSECTVCLCDQTVGHEVVKEITLADYDPDIRRVLAVRETVFPPATYIGAGRAEFNGIAEYRLLCVTAEGRLCTVNASSEYEFQAPLEALSGEMDAEEGVCLFVSSDTDHVSARLTAPRRIGLKHRISSRVRAYGAMTVGESFGGERMEGIQRLVSEGEQMVPFSMDSEPISFRDESPLPSVESSVISAEATVFVSSAIPKDGAVGVSGEVYLKLLTDREGAAEVLARKIPFDGLIEGEGFSENASVNATGVVENMTVSAEEGRVSCEGDILLFGRSMRRVPLRYTEDLYAVGCETECEYRECEIPLAIRCENRNLSQNEKIPLSEVRLPENAQILDIWGTARAEGYERRGDRIVHTGKSRYWILCEREGEYSVHEIELPLRYETEMGDREPVAGDCAMQVISCRARTDDETLHLDAEIAVSADYVGSETIQWVSAVRKGETCEEKRPCMMVYYPTPEDTPWTVAKKYRIPQDQLEGDIGSYFFF